MPLSQTARARQGRPQKDRVGERTDTYEILARAERPGYWLLRCLVGGPLCKKSFEVAASNLRPNSSCGCRRFISKKSTDSTNYETPIEKRFTPQQIAKVMDLRNRGELRQQKVKNEWFQKVDEVVDGETVENEVHHPAIYRRKRLKRMPLHSIAGKLGMSEKDVRAIVNEAEADERNDRLWLRQEEKRDAEEQLELEDAAFAQGVTYREARNHVCMSRVRIDAILEQAWKDYRERQNELMRRDAEEDPEWWSEIKREEERLQQEEEGLRMEFAKRHKERFGEHAEPTVVAEYMSTEAVDKDRAKELVEERAKKIVPIWRAGKPLQNEKRFAELRKCEVCKGTMMDSDVSVCCTSLKQAREYLSIPRVAEENKSEESLTIGDAIEQEAEGESGVAVTNAESSEFYAQWDAYLRSMDGKPLNDRTEPGVISVVRACADEEYSNVICISAAAESYLTIEQVAEILVVSTETVRRQFGHLDGVIDLGTKETMTKRKRSMLRIPRSTLDAFLRSKQVKVRRARAA